MKKTEIIKKFLSTHAPKDLADLYYDGMECQVNVSQGEGERIQGEYQGRSYFSYTDGLETWKAFRIPWNANSEPEYNDSHLSWNFDRHVESVGMTGWDWKERVSRWVAFDFDNILDHCSGLSANELKEIEELAQKLDYVTIRKSTSGSGLHIYVFLDPVIPTANHNHHAALGRAILTKMSSDLNVDFEAQVDVAGGNMWVWHKKMTDDNNGLKLIKQGQPLTTPPQNWEEHVDVIEGKRSRAIKRIFENDEEQKEFEDSIGKEPKIKLDNDHRKIIDFLEADTEWSSWPSYDSNFFYVTHTLALEKAHKELGLKGTYKTLSSGSTSHNCFMFPKPKGGWKVVRYGKNVREANTWRTMEDGTVYCLFNMPPTLRAATCFFGASENPKGGYNFFRMESAIEAAKALNVDLNLPEIFNELSGTFEEQGDGRLLVTVDGKGFTNRIKPPEGWSVNGTKYQALFNKVSTTEDKEINIVNNYDNILRFLVSDIGDKVGWYYNTPNNTEWGCHGREDIRDALVQRGYTLDEVKNIFGTCVNTPWKMVCLPFKEEFPGNRQWNKNAPQFAFPIKPNAKELCYPTWKKIFNHVGQTLTPVVRYNTWCQNNGIQTGADYLKVWCAYMFQKPHVHLPYLFFYSNNQQTGKSTFHEALRILFKDNNGYAHVENAVSEKFNETLANCVLCVIEELNLTKNKDAYNTIKKYTTADMLAIRPMGKATYHIQNNTHWVQCANKLNFLPIEPNDTRVVVIYVEDIPTHLLMKKEEMDRMLKKEASDFLTEILSIELPPSPDGRMGIPVLSTPEKERAELNKESLLETYIREQCFFIPGNIVLWDDFFHNFLQWLEPTDRHIWTKSYTAKNFPIERYPRGRNSKTNHMSIGNISYSDKEPAGRKLCLRKGRLTEIDY